MDLLNEALDTTYIDYVLSHSHNDTEYDSLKKDRDLLKEIVNLEKIQVLLDHQTISQPASTYTSWIFSANYAGYLEIEVITNAAENTFIDVT